MLNSSCLTPVPALIETPVKKIWRIATVNVQAGLSTNQYKDYLTQSWHHLSPTASQKTRNLETITKHINGFDILGVQELDAGSWRSSFKNQVDWFGQQIQLPYWHHQDNRKTLVSTTSNAIYSKHPIIQLEKWVLPSRKSEISPRGALRSIIHCPFSKIDWTCVVVHFSLHPKDRLAQSHYLAERLKNEEHVVLMGDFNAQPNSQDLYPLTQIMDGHTTEATYPRWDPKKSIDVIWWKGMDIHEQKVHAWGATDHCAVEIQCSPQIKFCNLKL